MKILPLKGYKSLRALNAFSALLLGLKMIPAYAHISYEEFYSDFQDMEELKKEKLLKEAVLFVELQRSEVESLISFVADPNGVPYGANNVSNLGAEELLQAIVDVCMEIGKIKIDLITEAEKKKFSHSPLMSAVPS